MSSTRNLSNEYTINLVGRQHYLLELKKIEKDFHQDTWTTMTRDLMHNLDHPLFDIKANYLTFLIDNRKSLPHTCGKWAPVIAATLGQLAQEMRLASRLFEFRHWDYGILSDALEVLRYSIFDFLGPIAMLLHHYCDQSKDVQYPGTVTAGASSQLQTYGEVGTLCYQSMIYAEIELCNLMTHLSRGQQAKDGFLTHEEMLPEELPSLKILRDTVNTPVANQVPTATFTELVIQNQIALQRRSIITTLGHTDLSNRYICMSPMHLLPTFTDFHHL